MEATRRWPYAKPAGATCLVSNPRGAYPSLVRGISIPPGVRGISIPPGERNVFQLSPACGRSRRVRLDPSGNYRFQKRAHTEQNIQRHTHTAVSQTLRIGGPSMVLGIPDEPPNVVPRFHDSQEPTGSQRVRCKSKESFISNLGLAPLPHSPMQR
uniref:Uncharacterized protein n=1 Tax=Myotis myotis TaxID=51298 RepID=A0A7J7VI69_MYOMY|nr:hypothetical protein mMyoMyo1_008358 [Myotis myotis]